MKTGDLIMAHGDVALVLEMGDGYTNTRGNAKILMSNGWQKWVSVQGEEPLENGTFTYEVNSNG